jgi:serine/threonine-protein kinase
VLFEIVSGKRPFEGEEVTETLAAVLKDAPDWTALPANLPPSIRTVIQGCLKKDRRERIANISTVRFLLNEPQESPPVAVATAGSTRWMPKAVGLLFVGVVLGAIGMTGFTQLRSSPVLQVTRFPITLPDSQQLTFSRRVVAISPDGTTVAFTAGGRLYLRSMSDLESHVVAGADRAIGPTFSPDSRSLAFWADGEIKRISVSGGVPVSLYRTGATSAPSSLTWEGRGILFPQAATGIMRLSPDGGKPDVLVPVSLSDGFAHGPQLLPDGETLLFTLTTDSQASVERWDSARIVAQSLKTGKRETIIEGGTDARYVPTGHIVYALGGTVFAVPFDVAAKKKTGPITPVIDGVMRVIADSGTAQFAFSNSGSLVYVKGAQAAGQQQLFMFDRAGVAEPVKLPPGLYRFPRVSPDGTRIAFESSDGKESFVSIYELSGTNSAQRLTYGGNNRFPIWSRDGKHVVFQSDRGGNPAVFWQPVDGGAAEPLTTPDPGTSHVPEAWSPTEDVLLFNVANKAETSLWMMSMNDRKPVRFDDVTSAVLPTDAVFSPDGHWVAYQAAESGTGGEGNLYVQPFPPTGNKQQIARQAGRPLWSRDGKQLFFIPAPGVWMVVSITRQQPALTFTNPASVPRAFSISGPLNQRMFDIAVTVEYSDSHPPPRPRVSPPIFSPRCSSSSTGFKS